MRNGFQRLHLLAAASAVVLAFLVGVAARAEADATAPTLVTLTVTPTNIDTSTAAATVDVTARVTDAGAGVARVFARFRHDAGERQGATLSRTSGTAADGIYAATLTFPELAAAGTWPLLVVVEDAVGNRRDLHADDLAALSLPATLTNTATTDDHTPPVLIELSMAPPGIDTSAAAATIDVTARAADAGVGVASVAVELRHASGARHSAGLPRTSGTTADGIYAGTLTIPQLAPAGTWTVVVALDDTLGNERELHADDLVVLGLPATVTNTAASDDHAAPTLVELAVTPASIDTRFGTVNVAVTARVSDGGAGVDSVYAELRHAGGQRIGTFLTRTSGSAADGNYVGAVSLPEDSASGTRTLVLTLQDAVGNRRDLHADDLTALGFSATGTTVAAPVPQLAYVTNIGSASVLVIELDGNTVVATVPGLSGAVGVAAAADGTRVYVAQETSSTSAIDTATQTVSASIATGVQTAGVALNRAGTRAYVTNRQSNTVEVIDTASNTILATTTVGGTPFGVVVSSNGSRVYVANETTNSVSVIDTATNAVVATVGGVDGAKGIAINPAGTRVYVAAAELGALAVVDTVDNTLLTTVAVGALPYGVAMAPDGARVYVANELSQTVVAVDTATNTVAATIAVGALPRGVMVDASGTRVLVANGNAASVSVIDATTDTVVATIPVGGSPVGLGNGIAHPAHCGDGALDHGEACDDGIVADGDGCSRTCGGQPLPTATATPTALPTLTPSATAMTPTPTVSATPTLTATATSLTATPTPSRTTTPTPSATETETPTPTPTHTPPHGITGRVVSAMTFSGADLYVGGQFDAAGNTPASSVARWDSTRWYALGTGVDGPVFAMATIGTDVYVAGDFQYAGDLPVARVAKWNGSTWSPLGTGLGDTVRALFILNNELHATGDFQVDQSHVAKWNGSAWVGLVRVDSPTYALTALGGEPYVISDFESDSNRLARWDGSMWNLMGGSFREPATALTVYGGQIIAGGGFQNSVGGMPDYLTRWDGTTWLPVGGGVDSDILAFAVDGTNLYAAGELSTAGGVPANFVARFDGSTWSALGDGVDNRVEALALAGGTLYVGGWFGLAGGQPASRVARFDGTAWHALDDPPTDDGLFCTVGEVCAAGSCSGGTARDCSAAGDACTAGACDELLDRCVATPVADGTPCSDGNACTGGDQCASGLCVGAPAACGDGAVDGACSEHCDDADQDAGDGCSATCRVEDGFRCVGAPSVCTPSCGNAAVESGEACDDGDLGAGDGCTATCAVEPGWTCPAGSPSVCVATCGDGLKVAAEQCDDGNPTDDDGCESDCTLTPKSLTVTAQAGGTVESDVEHDGASALDPIETGITTPNGGAITITRQPASGQSPAGFVFLGQEVVISAPPATATAPLRFAFVLDPSLGSGVTTGNVPVFRNGSAVATCTGPAGQAVPDPCIASRTLLPNGEDLEIVVFTSAASTWTFTADVCGPTPATGCRRPVASGKATLKITQSGTDTKDALQWTWQKGAPTTMGDLGDPTTSSPYVVCLYDASGLRVRLAVPPGGQCSGKACWTPKAGSYAYKDKLGSADGVLQLQTKADARAGKPKIQLKGRGAALDLPMPLDLASPVTVQLVAPDTCFEAVFSSPFGQTGPDRFNDKSD